MFLTADKVCKTYGRKEVLHSISFQIKEGSVLGLVGRNGSGKTVLLKCISGLAAPTSGQIVYRGRTVGKEIEMPEDMGILIESPGFLAQYDGLTNLSLFMGIRRRPDKEYLRGLMKKVGLDPDNKTKAGRYSLGMKQRLGLAMALMDEPKLLLLDEPMNGLDIHGVREMRELLISLRRKGVSMILASHIIGDIKTLCDQVLYLEGGRSLPPGDETRKMLEGGSGV